MMERKERSFIYWGFVSVVNAVFMMGFLIREDTISPFLFFLLFLFSFMAFGYTSNKLDREAKKYERKSR